MAVTIVQPSAWGMPPITRAVDTRTLDVVDEANVHHSDSDPPANHGLCDDAVRAFDADHRNVNGWAAIGYHRVICPHGDVFLGRGLTVVPAAALGHNTPIVAYCLIAKAGRATPVQWSALRQMAALDAGTVGRPLKWTTHREVWPHTECPGDAIQQQVDELRRTAGPTVAPSSDHKAAGLSRTTRLAVRLVRRRLLRRRAPLTSLAAAQLHALMTAVDRALHVK